MKYPEIEKYKSEDEFWKRFFLKSTCYIKLMKEKYDFDYTFGDFDTQYKLLKKYNNKQLLLTRSAESGELAIVIWCLKKEDGIYKNDAFIWACVNGHLEIIKYLVNNGVNIRADNDSALREASRDGQLEVVKYLVEKGANIHVGCNYPLRSASKNGHFEVVKYLIEQGANINDINAYDE